jgi:hypothetical protein
MWPSRFCDSFAYSASRSDISPPSLYFDTMDDHTWLTTKSESSKVCKQIFNIVYIKDKCKKIINFNSAHTSLLQKSMT